MNGRTSFMIAHRLSSILDANVILHGERRHQRSQRPRCVDEPKRKVRGALQQSVCLK